MSSQSIPMGLRSQQILAGILAMIGIDAGLWAAAWPRQFYDSFPGLGRHWVSAMGPYNEHLVRDVGGLYLAMAAISIWGLARPRRDTFAMLGLGWLCFNIPHAIFHMRNLDRLTNKVDQIGNVVTLNGVLLVALLLLIPPRRTRPDKND